MVLSVFFSHSTAPEDSWIINSVENYYHTNPQLGVNMYVAERHPEPGRPISDKIMDRIRNADCVLLLLTENGIYSRMVNREYQSAIENKKLIIPLVEKPVEKEAQALLEGKEYIPFDRNNPRNTLNWLVKYLDDLKGKKDTNELIKNILIAGTAILGVIGLAAFLGKQGGDIG